MAGILCKIYNFYIKMVMKGNIIDLDYSTGGIYIFCVCERENSSSSQISLGIWFAFNFKKTLFGSIPFWILPLQSLAFI